MTKQPIDPLKVYEGHKRHRNRHPAQGYPPGATAKRMERHDELVPGAFVVERPSEPKRYHRQHVTRRAYDKQNEFTIQQHVYAEHEKPQSIIDAWTEYRTDSTWPRATEKINNTVRYKEKR